MSYSVDQINSCTKKLAFSFENVDLSQQIEEALSAKQKESNLKGFRKGKAPLSMVKQVYGAQVQNDALYRFVSQEFYKAIQEEDIKAIGYPSFANTKFENDVISFDATVETFPEFELKDYSKYSFTKDDDSVKESDIKEMRERLLAPKSQMTPKEDDAKISKGDFVTFDFEGEKADGSRPDNMKANDFQLEIGSGQFIPGFEEGMEGLKKGDVKEVKLTFPADYHEQDLQGAPVTFHVKVHEIKEKKLPELNDDLAKELGFDSVDDMEDKNKKRLEIQKKREVQTKLQEEILNKLIEENSFDVPNTLLEQQKKSVQEELGQTLKMQGFTDDMLGTYFEKWSADVESKAKFQVRSGLILDRIAKDLKVETSESDLKAKIQQITEGSGMEQTQVEEYYLSNPQGKANLEYAIREEKTFEKLIQKMSVK